MTKSANIEGTMFWEQNGLLYVTTPDGVTISLNPEQAARLLRDIQDALRSGCPDGKVHITVYGTQIKENNA